MSKLFTVSVAVGSLVLLMSPPLATAFSLQSPRSQSTSPSDRILFRDAYPEVLIDPILVGRADRVSRQKEIEDLDSTFMRLIGVKVRRGRN